MELTLIYRACFLVAFNIISFKGHYCYLLVCYGEYNYRTARFECGNLGGRMVSMATVDLYKDVLSEKIFCRGKNKQKFWLKKMQGLSSSNFSSFSCSTEVDNCPYFEMTNDTILCKETNCDRKFPFLCEKDELLNLRHCVPIDQPSINASTECYDQEISTMNNSYTNGNITVTKSFQIRGKSSNMSFVLTIVICLGLSMILLLSTIPIFLKRRLFRLKAQTQNNSMMDEDGYQEIYFKDHSHTNSVQRISIKSLTYSSMLMIKEEPQEDTTADKNNVYSKFSVQSSVYNKLKRGRRTSRKNNNSDPDIYSTLSATQAMGLEVNNAKDNDDVVVVDESKTPIAKEDDCSDIASSGQNGQYCTIKEVSKVKESDNSPPTDDTQIHTIQFSSESPKVAVSGGCYELAKTFPENDRKSQSCKMMDYEMATNLLVNGNSAKSESCSISDYEMARL